MLDPDPTTLLSALSRGQVLSPTLLSALSRPDSRLRIFELETFGACLTYRYPLQKITEVPTRPLICALLDPYKAQAWPASIQSSPRKDPTLHTRWAQLQSPTTFPFLPLTPLLPIKSRRLSQYNCKDAVNGASNG